MQFIQSDAQLRPVMGRYKVYVILYAEELAEDAGNRLLKTIEEPPPFVMFLLTAIERGGVLPTIASRCQELRLRPAARDELASALSAAGLSLSGHCSLPRWPAGARDGRWPRRASRRSSSSSDVYAPAGGRARRLADGPAVRARALSERWATQPETVRETLRVWMSWWRDVMLVQLGLLGRVVHLDAGEQQSLRGAAAQRRAGRRPARRRPRFSRRWLTLTRTSTRGWRSTCCYCGCQLSASGFLGWLAVEWRLRPLR